MTDATPAAATQTAEVAYIDFCRYFPYTPTALAIRECVRLAKIKNLPCQEPVLDVGCGDGLFARLAFKVADVWGVDIDANEGRFAQASKAYSQIIIGDVTQLKLPEGFFSTCVANCSLEHVPNLDIALGTMYRALKPGGVAYLFVPTREWASHLRSVIASEKIGLPWLANAISSGIDGVFRHYHLHDADAWRAFCERAGFEVLELSPIGSVACIQAFEAFLVPSLLGLVTKKITGRWTISPTLRQNLAFPAYMAVQLMLRLSRNLEPNAEYFLAVRRPEEA